MKRTYQPCTCSIECDEEAGHCQHQSAMTKRPKIVVNDNGPLFQMARSVLYSLMQTNLTLPFDTAVTRETNTKVRFTWIRSCSETLTSWQFIDVWWPKYSNPIYRKLVIYQMKRELHPTDLKMFKLYCLLKMVCK